VTRKAALKLSFTADDYTNWRSRLVRHWGEEASHASNARTK
jgi:hypothetical protein